MLPYLWHPTFSDDLRVGIGRFTTFTVKSFPTYLRLSFTESSEMSRCPPVYGFNIVSRPRVTRRQSDEEVNAP